MDPIAIAWGQELVRYRERQKINQTQLAALLNVHQTTISQIELGRRVPSYRLQRRIIDALGFDDSTVLRLARGEAA